jgi:hypothetical protein
VQSEGIIIVHPNWWGQPPAILKGKREISLPKDTFKVSIVNFIGWDINTD